MTDGRGGGDDWNDPLSDIDFEEFELGEPGSYTEFEEPRGSYQAPAPALVTCPSCGAAQPATNRHCEQCGARLSQAALPVAPRPLANISAGTRALTVILAVLAGVVVLALGFQIFGGDEPTDTAGGDTTTETSTPGNDGTTVTTAGSIQQVFPVSITCASELNTDTLACANLIDRDPATIWNDASQQGVGATFTVTFGEPVALEQVHFTNIAEDVRFRRNFRVNGVELIANDLPGLPIIGQIPNDNSRNHVVTAQTLGTTTLVIKVVSTYPAEAVEGRAFDELALAELAFWGRPVESTAPTDNTNSGG